MKVFKEIAPLKEEIKRLKASGKTIGFVPTMGNLHEGHLSLIRESIKECDVTFLSIYVNPKQFAGNEDLDKYPRTLERDLELAKKEGCHITFVPSDELMYPDGYSTYVSEESLSLSMEGKIRPRHFRGVLTIVTKLFNIVEPDKAYFGQKDAQQAIVIKKLTRDLNIPASIKVCPIIREKSGLAMSSRNNYFSQEDRVHASIIYKALSHAEESFKSGNTNAAGLERIIREKLKHQEIRIDYIDFRSADSLEPVSIIKEDCLLAIGATFKGIHLIDNLILKRGKD